MYMKKAICTIVVALMMPLAVMADSYGSLWKQYELLQRKNQPRSAIHVLEQIAAKARADKAYGQLIKAQFGLTDAWEDLEGREDRPCCCRHLLQCAGKPLSG